MLSPCRGGASRRRQTITPHRPYGCIIDNSVYFGLRYYFGGTVVLVSGAMAGVEMPNLVGVGGTVEVVSPGWVRIGGGERMHRC